jgi:hypothetical protein
MKKPTPLSIEDLYKLYDADNSRFKATAALADIDSVIV